ncbi:L,D-transpeptidase [Rhizobium sp. SRDI969]|uniref:L,D-transpeptidase n=1 Tax=Rhizobium sp. SRDI969 TaxID=3138252 RepID=UPI0021A80B5A|nr:L,D-transpeptidase [Rhizobium leguminosarum]UWM82503.1 L,D-transpeptidase [Rhizobium leguminosarum bv. viciae]
MRVLVLVAALLLTAFAARAQVYGSYDGYDDYGGDVYDDPYSLYPPIPDYEPVPRHRDYLPDRGPLPRQSPGGTILIVTSQHTLYYTTPWGEQYAYPIAVGREGKQWFGSTRVVSKKEHPEWRPTASMRQKNPKLPTVVRPGPSNPLGTRAIYLADGLLRIHGTNDPSSIGTNASSGCFRMYRQDVEELYELVQPGTHVIVRR